MQTMHVNGYDMAYLDLGVGPAVVCVHGSLNDFRAWATVLKPLSAAHRLIVPSLRHYFPEHWDGKGGRFTIDQHVDDVIALIEGLDVGAVSLIGHSRGGHIGFRLALKRPDLIAKLILAEPGGELDESLTPPETPVGAGMRGHVAEASRKIQAGEFEAGLRIFVDGVNGPGAWDRLAPMDRQMREDNAYTLLAQPNEGRRAYRKADAASLQSETLFVCGGDTPGMLPVVLHALASNAPNARAVTIPNAGHSMFRDQPKLFCAAVLPFLDG